MDFLWRIRWPKVVKNRFWDMSWRSLCAVQFIMINIQKSIRKMKNFLYSYSLKYFTIKISQKKINKVKEKKFFSQLAESANS